MKMNSFSKYYFLIILVYDFDCMNLLASALLGKVFCIGFNLNSPTRTIARNIFPLFVMLPIFTPPSVSKSVSKGLL